MKLLLAVLAIPLILGLPLPASSAAEEEDNCASAPNPIVCENALPGDPPSEWHVRGAGDPTIQGYASSMSVDAGQTEQFKIDTPATSYHMDILRLGYYGGDGARLVASGIAPTAQLPQTQPECLKEPSTGLIDCGNWGVSAQWSVPSNAVSGVYIALLTRDDTGGKSQIVFVVRNDSSHSEILLQTSDATWQAYNDYGGNSLYTCTVDCPPGEPEAYKAAYAVSYNRPFDGSFTTDNGQSYLYYAEYQMIYWLEENGYNVGYTTEAEVANQGALLENHKIFISDGHDEYWSSGQRESVEAARAAGVNLAFFSGNEMFWKTRWGNSIDGSNAPYRTLITYKETHFNAPVDPQDPPTWTGAWSDPRFSPPGDGGRPANSITGQYFLINSGSGDITVPYRYSRLRLWRNTAVSTLAPGSSLTLAPGNHTLGYEWDLDLDNGFRPAGEFDTSSTTLTGLQKFSDYGSNLASETSDPGEPGEEQNESASTATHHLTLYRDPGGGLVFGAGTVQWSWGLANINAWDSSATEPSGNPPDPNMEQATVNLLADMGAQPSTLISGLLPATQSTDATPPTSTITSPESGDTLQDGSQVTITGTATDGGGGVVAGVEVSTDDGATWHPATVTTPAEQSVNWSYAWSAHGYPTTTIKSRAVDDSANLESPSAGVQVDLSCPCSIWGDAVTPPIANAGDPSGVELGTKFTSDVFGTATGVRFYKSAANTGTHLGSLWSATGQLLAQATFTSETASGWQQVNFSTPVDIFPNTTYVISYFAPSGHYAATSDYFYTPAATGGNALNAGPLHAVPASVSTTNGMYSYGSTSTFPSNTFNATNYWVDVAFDPASAPGQVTNVSATAGSGSASVSWSAPSSGGPVTTYTITPFIGSEAQPATTLVGSPPDAAATVEGLTAGTSYTFTVQASNPAGSGPVSAPSSPITPSAVEVPAAPTGVSASPATNRALVSWTPSSSDGGSAITGYTVTPFVDATPQTPVQVGPSTTSATVTGLTNGTSYTFTVAATNSIGTSQSSSESNTVTPDDTIFEFTTPSTIDAGDPSSVELGVKFTPEVAGDVTGIRFYKAETNTGTHIGSLWSASGTLLASATFTSESDSGWQQVNFSSPVPISAGTTFIAAYLAPNGHYSDDPSGLGSGVNNPPLQALADGISPDGVYAYSSSSTFPDSSFDASNYYVDVLFEPTGDPFIPEPTVTKVEPNSGPAAGGTSVAITGTAFRRVFTNGSGEGSPFVKAVRFGAVNATSFAVESETKVSAVAPPGTGMVDVTVETERGTSPTSTADEFTYPTPSFPTVVTGAASSVTQTSATLDATVNPNAGEVNECKFEYGPTAAYGKSAPCTPSPGSGESPVAVAAPLTGLATHTTYHLRISATNFIGTSNGSDETFTTLPNTNAAGHWYRNGTTVSGGVKVPTVGWGTLTLTSSAGALTCKAVTAGYVENPVGGGPGLSATQSFDTYECSAAECPLETRVEAFKEPWTGELIAEESIRRNEITGIEEVTGCWTAAPAGPGGESTSDRGTPLSAPLAFAGTLTPKIRNGITAGKPTHVEYGAGSGGLESTSVGAGTTTGSTTLLGYNEQETIIGGT